MKAIEEKHNSDPYSAENMAKPVNFYCAAPYARTVELQGDFSDWRPIAMQHRVDGWWFLQVPVTHGHHHYRFIVDGKPHLDPRAAGIIRNEAGEEVSVLAVS